MTTEDADREKYLFGDSDLAAKRLRLLAGVFAPSTRKFLSRFVPESPRTVLDIGCGPGQTTRLLAKWFGNAAVYGVDISPAFIELAKSERGTRARFELADVTHAIPGGPYDLIYSRYVLAHLARPVDAIALWAARLSDRGVIAIEENEWIRSDVPAFNQYLAIVEAMLAHQGQKLYIGRELEQAADGAGLVRQSSELAPIVVDPRDAARMFVMNIVGWRKQPFVTSRHSAGELDALQQELARLATAQPEGSITFCHHQLVIGKWR